jgi:hypothetical protein
MWTGKQKGSGAMLPALPKSISAETDHLNELLDEALKETFPASDPVAITVDVQPTLAAPTPHGPSVSAADRGTHATRSNRGRDPAAAARSFRG